MKVSVIFVLLICLEQGLTSPTTKPDSENSSTARKARRIYGSRTRQRNRDTLGSFGGGVTSSGVDFGSNFAGVGVEVTTTVGLLEGLSDTYASFATSGGNTSGNFGYGSAGVHIPGNSEEDTIRNATGNFFPGNYYGAPGYASIGAGNTLTPTGGYDSTAIGSYEGIDKLTENKPIDIGFGLANDSRFNFGARYNLQPPFPTFSMEGKNNTDDSNCICPNSSGWTPDQLSDHQKRMNITGGPFDCICLGSTDFVLVQQTPSNLLKKPTMSCFCPKTPGWSPDQYALLSKQSDFAGGLNDCYCARPVEISDDLKEKLENSILEPTGDETYQQSHLSVVSLDGDLKEVRLGPLYIRLS